MKRNPERRERKRIGVLGGLGPESTTAFYQSITRSYYVRFADYAYPEIIIYSLEFQPFIDGAYENHGRIKSAVESLAAAGADFAVAACNSIHIVFEKLRGQTAIPWISIMDVTAEEIKRARMRKVGLLGTIFTMTRPFFRDALARHHIETILPEADAQQRLNRIIYDELITQTLRGDSKKFVLGCLDQLVAAGAEGVILGCTELPLLVGQADTETRLFDTTALHARCALDIALGSRDISEYSEQP